MDFDGHYDFDCFDEELPTDDEAAQRVAVELERTLCANYGKGAGKVSAAFLGDDGLICILQELEFHAGEKFLIERGESDAVMQSRLRFQRAIEPAFRAVVEHGTGRRVDSHDFTTSIDPPLSVEFFFFASAS